MRTFIQLRDGIGYATVITPTDAPDHSVTPDNVTAIEVFTDNPDEFLNKTYDAVTKTWSESERFVYAEVDETGRMIELRQTYFLTDTIGKPIITPEVKPDWLWINGQWVIPEVIEVEQAQIENETPTYTEEERLARVAAAMQGD